MAINGTKKERIRKSLRYSILDGAFYSSMVGFGESFFSVFAIFLKATNTQLGLLGSLPQALGSLTQLYSNRLIGFFRTRKRFVCAAALLEALMYIPIALVFFFGTLKVFHLIFFICLYWVFGMIGSAAWSSWMGDLVDEKQRGHYFGRRNRIGGLVSFVTFLFGGFILQSFAGREITQYIGFIVIFAFAMISRIISFIYLSKKYEPGYRLVEEARFSFLDFVKRADSTNYGNLVLYLCLMNFSVYVAGPFFAAYMLNDLEMSYLTFTIVSATAIIVKYLAMPVWGMAADRFGTRKVLSISGFLMPLVPLLWVLSSNVWFLMLVQIYSGLTWAGFELTSFNFIFDTTTPAKRATCISYYNVLNGASIFIGAMVGSAIVKYNDLFWSKYLLVFVISAVLRYVASFIFIPKLREVRIVESISYKRLFLNILTSMPTMGLVHNIIHIGRKGQAK